MANRKCFIRFHVGKYYEVTDIVLGRGSFSTVYLARHKAFGNRVALKIIDRNNIKEEYVSRNLYRESRILKKLNHPNIVNFYEDFLHNNLYCLAMEFINGTDLTQYLKKQTDRRLPEKAAKSLFFQMISAVQHMHDSHILHRDLKQENILLEFDKVIKIVDFGLSNVYQPNIKLRTHCGSLVYAAPELFHHHSSYGAGVDLWSLGVILYSMVVGCMPFEIPRDLQSNKEQFYRRISEGLTEDNWEIMGNLSYDCCNLLESLLQPDQHKRIGIRETKQHYWFLAEEDVRKTLPIARTNLGHKETEIIDFMSEKLSKPVERIVYHLSTNKFDKVSAVFHMLHDTLLKEVLYPPNDLEKSFMYQLECRKKTRRFKSERSFKQEQEDDQKFSRRSNGESSSRDILSQNRSSIIVKSEQKIEGRTVREQAPEKRQIFIAKRDQKNVDNIANIRKRIGDGIEENKLSLEEMPNLISKSVSSRNTTPQRSETLSTSINSCDEVKPLPYRSYKYNRPPRFQKMQQQIANTSTGDSNCSKFTAPRFQKAQMNNSSIKNDLIKNVDSDKQYKNILPRKTNLPEERLENSDRRSRTFVNTTQKSCYENIDRNDDVKVLSKKFLNECRVSSCSEDKQKQRPCSDMILRKQQRLTDPPVNNPCDRKFNASRTASDFNTNYRVFNREQRVHRPNTGSSNQARRQDGNWVEHNTSGIRDTSLQSLKPVKYKQRPLVIRRSDSNYQTGKVNDFRCDQKHVLRNRPSAECGDNKSVRKDCNILQTPRYAVQKDNFIKKNNY